jgi:hypothetical protein
MVLTLLSLSCGGKGQEIREMAAEKLEGVAEKLADEGTATPTEGSKKSTPIQHADKTKGEADSRLEVASERLSEDKIATPSIQTTVATTKSVDALSEQLAIETPSANWLEFGAPASEKTLIISRDATPIDLGKHAEPKDSSLADLEPDDKKPSWVTLTERIKNTFIKKMLTDWDKDQERRVGEADSVKETPSGITIRGRLFYNDLRYRGRFGDRRDPSGDPGVGISSLNSNIDKKCYKTKNSDCVLLDEENLLAARKVVATFWEVDREYERKDRRDCEDFQYLGRSTVGKYGTYSLELPNLEDNCKDGNPKPEIEVLFRLKYCAQNKHTCFSLKRIFEDGEYIYKIWNKSASPNNPLRVDPDTVYDLGDSIFGQNILGDEVDREWAMAANHYATLVDTMYVLHNQAEIPFKYDNYGEVVVEMCEKDYAKTFKGKHITQCARGYAYSAGLIKITQPEIWPIGPLVAHEYGHVLQRRASDGTYGWKKNIVNSDCRPDEPVDCPYGRRDEDKMKGGVVYNSNYEANESWGNWSGDTYEYPKVAFKEGWANFVANAVMDRCAEIDENSNSGQNVYPHYSDGGQVLLEAMVNSTNTGNGYPGNVTKFLCDWYDEHPAQDDDAELVYGNKDLRPGYGDRFREDLLSMWLNLEELWQTSTSEQRESLTICDYAKTYITAKRGKIRVEGDTHSSYEDLIVNLLYNNGLKCGYDKPDG